MGKPQNSEEPGNAYLNLMSGFGMALAVLGFGCLILPFRGESYEWAQYMLIGGVFTPLLHAGYFLFRSVKMHPVLELLRQGSALAAVAFCFFFIPGGDIPLLAVFALTSWFFLGGAQGLSRHGWKEHGRSIFILAVMFAAWGLYFRLAPVSRFVTGGAQQILAVVLAAAFAFWYRPHEAVHPAASRILSIPRILAEVALITVLALAAFRAPDSINENHEFFVGAAALVRQGGWLLWDVPSQYGFLNILLVAVLPFKSVHFSLYAASSAFQLVCALVMYGMVRSLRPDPFGAVAGIFVTITMAFMVSGGTPQLAGLNTTPSIGGMRYIVSYLLLAWSYWNIVSGNNGGGARRVRFWAGSLTVAVGCLWSAESMIYSLSIWLPQSLWLSWETAKQRYGTANIHLPWRAALIFLSSLLPVLILFLAVNGYYLAGLGHFPDWYAFIDFAMAYSGGFGAFPIDPRGGVWGLLLLFTAVSICAAAAFRDRLAVWPALVGILGLFWSTSSYFICRSSESNILNLAPLHFTCALAVMAAFRHKPVQRLTLWAALIPMIGVFFIVTWGNPNLHRFFSETFRLDHQARINQLMPKAGKPLVDILQEVNCKKGDPLIVVNDMLPPSIADVGLNAQPDNAESYRFWLPIAPATELLLLPPARRKIYITRFADRFHEGGWMVLPHEIPTEDVEGFFADIDAKYQMTFARNNSDWQVRRYEPH